MPARILVGCVVCAGLILIEFGSISSQRPSPGTRLPPAEIEPAAPESRKLADPLLNPTQRRPETASSADDADSLLRGVRLTGVVIGPDLRIAIFAVTGGNSRMLSEGEALKGWRLDSISPKEVVLSGPAGNILLKPQSDANLVRSPPPIEVQSDQPGPAMARPPGQPIAVTPIAVGNLSAATPVQTQGYPNYLPEYNPGYDPYYSWGWDNPWDWGWPVGVSVGFGGCWNCGFRGGFFRPGFRHFGFDHPGLFHSGFGRFGLAHASFAGGFRGGGRR
ncbi:MAG: hypothetical protein JO307_25570 [Bryobacterales bacterium]|nr:hypothetical protein [Bryobacterales bacterium]